MILRPDAVVLPGPTLASGLEVCVSENKIAEVRPWTSSARDEVGCVLSPAFVNAHSHLEYRDLQGAVEWGDYWQWIRRITALKPTRSFEEVLMYAECAAKENLHTGVAAIGETSDWPVSGKAMKDCDLGGRIFQEVITFADQDHPWQKLETVIENSEVNRSHSGLPVNLAAHAPYTVSLGVLQRIADKQDFTSIHLAESIHENEFYCYGKGPIADLYRSVGYEFSCGYRSVTEYMNSCGFLSDRTQIVHACDLDDEDIELLSTLKVSVAHCPRSNSNLSCPHAPVSRLRKKGIVVGLGLDSAASSGTIDFFAEMRASREVSLQRREPLTYEDIWQIATSDGAKSIWLDRSWQIEPGGDPDMILMQFSGRVDFQNMISSGSPENVIKLIRMNQL